MEVIIRSISCLNFDCLDFAWIYGSLRRWDSLGEILLAGIRNVGAELIVVASCDHIVHNFCSSTLAEINSSCFGDFKVDFSLSTVSAACIVDRESS